MNYTPLEFRDVMGFLVCFSLNDPYSFKNVKHWLHRIQQYGYTRDEVSIILVGTKSDLPRAVSERRVEAFLREVQLPYMECSARDDVGVDEVFDKLTKMVLPGEGHLFYGTNVPRRVCFVSVIN